MSFAVRQLNVTFALGQGAFGVTGENTTTLSGLRMSARIDNIAGAGMSTLSLAIDGAPVDTMNKLTTLGFIVQKLRRNAVTVTAGDASGALSTVFIGQIQSAWFEGSDAPNACFRVQASAGLIEAVTPSLPKGYTDGADVADMIKTLAGEAGLTFENNGVSVILSKQYLSGDLRNQMQQAADAANINIIIERGTVAIWPKTGYRAGDVPLIAPGKGLVGYPAFTASGLKIRAEFTPTIKVGGQVQIQSSLQAAVGTWSIAKINYALDCEFPNGEWFVDVECYNFAAMQASGGGAPVVQ